jgi:hypothetical protein
MLPVPSTPDAAREPSGHAGQDGDLISVVLVIALQSKTGTIRDSNGDRASLFRKFAISSALDRLQSWTLYER